MDDITYSTAFGKDIPTKNSESNVEYISTVTPVKYVSLQPSL